MSVIATTFIEVLPSLLWVLLAAIALAVFYRPLRNDVIPNLRSVKLPGGIEFGIGGSGPVVAGARILWVDDHPENNINEATTLGTFGAVIRFATSNTEAW